MYAIRSYSGAGDRGWAGGRGTGMGLLRALATVSSMTLLSRVLRGEAPGSIPTYFPSEPAENSLVINLDVAARLGLSVPPEIV